MVWWWQKFPVARRLYCACCVHIQHRYILLCNSDSNNFGKWYVQKNSFKSIHSLLIYSFDFESRVWARYVSMTIEKPEPSVTFVLKVSLALILVRILFLSLLPPIHTPNFNLIRKQGTRRAPMPILTRNLIEFYHQLINCRVRVTGVYNVHFKMTGGPCNLIDSHQCDLFTIRTIVCSKSHFSPIQWDSFS